MAGSAAAWPVACALGAAGLLCVVAARGLEQRRLSALDAIIAASATGALLAELEADPATTVAAAGVAAGIALSRWRSDRAVLLGAAGLAALAVAPLGVVVAAPAFALAVLRPGPVAGPGPEFKPVVLGAILVCATASLALLTAGQFEALEAVTVALASVTVLAGMARAGLTVVEQLRESRRLAITDDLTGLANRRHLIERLRTALAAAAAAGTELALLLVDLDGFKELNDTLGHRAGDEVLHQIGPRLQRLLREQDTLARLGGDEFAVVLWPGTRWPPAPRRCGCGARSSSRSRSATSGCTSTPASASRSSRSTRPTRRPAPARGRGHVRGEAPRTGHEVYLPRAIATAASGSR